MSFLTRGLFVVGGIIAGATAIDYFVIGNSSDYRLPNARLGPWREAQVRPACYRALDFPQKDIANPRMPPEPNRVSPADFARAVELTAALNCYVVTQSNAVCEPSNRAYIVDYVGKYFAKKNQMLATAKNYGREEVQKVNALWDAPNNRAIASALDRHIRDGRLAKPDFGFSTPDELKPALQKYAEAPDLCAKERPWKAAAR